MSDEFNPMDMSQLLNEREWQKERRKAWVRAWCAAVGNDETSFDDCFDIADQLLASFDQRFGGEK